MRKIIGERFGLGWALRLAVAALFSVLLSLVPAGAQTSKVAILLQLQGVVGPASSDYITRGLRTAVERNASLVIIQMDTPGGLDTSMRDIIQGILASPVPVAVYVAPSGARAASAGTYILYASHIAAMAPGTNLGAATPVQIGGLPLPNDDQDKNETKKDSEGKTPSSNSPMETKAVNDAAAYIKSLAELRARNVDWAEKAVREAASLSANAAAKENVIDIVAGSVDDLLLKLNGRSVRAGGNDIKIDTEGLTIERLEPDWRTELLMVITNPNVALMLLTIGIYGLIFEFLTPGSFFPGTIGAICLLIGLYALAILPVNLAGLGLIILGLALMGAEAFTPSGVLAVGGAVAFIAGATILIDTDIPAFKTSWPIVGGIALTSLALSLIIVRLALTSHRRPVVTGSEEMARAAGEVLDWRGLKGHVLARGERWTAISETPLKKGQRVRVAGIKGIILKVEPDQTDGT